MLFNLAPDLQLDYNKLTDVANLIVGKSGSKENYVYAIDTIMFHDMLNAIVKMQSDIAPQPVTINSPYVNNGDIITVSKGVDYVRVNFKCKFQAFTAVAVQTVDKVFNLKPDYALRFVETITGKLNKEVTNEN